MNSRCFCPSREETSFSLAEGTGGTNLWPQSSVLSPLQVHRYEEIPSWKETEKMLANAMAGLSAEDRNATLDELHGIRKANINDGSAADDLARKMEEMHEWMERHPNRAYELAKNCQNGFAYVYNAEFRSYFLHSTDSGTPKDAAKKMLSFFEQKLQLFGEEALCRPITLEDLHDEDVEFLMEGFFQYLGKDSSGRQVIGTFPTQLNYKSIDSFNRAMYYFMMTLFPETNCPERHSVCILYSNILAPRNADLARDFQLVKRALSLGSALPRKTVANHITLDHSYRDPSVLLIIKLSQRRSRYNFIIGSHMEVQYELRRFGIFTFDDRFPVNLGGELSLKRHHEWIKSRMLMEESKSPDLEPKGLLGTDNNVDLGLGLVMVSTLRSFHSALPDHHPTLSQEESPKTESLSTGKEEHVEPRNSDVLFGRGMHTQKHVGNCKFRNLLEKNFFAYENASNDVEKRILIEALYHHLQTKMGFRFLKQSTKDGAAWVIQEDRKAIYAKFSQTFRSIRAANRRISAKAELLSQQQLFSSSV
ncbi:hypothetical protein IV203_018771 [Nitzschia inconspicua]|uniref:DUF6824 domain-containing protein n=1 Tax=Nitzschia inconspicua TaxID=303405 RepID=A0A9K3Q6B5_9STRA|nr:hypothetical protein IV203_018771 [Nitzschia inconspicua]